MAAGHQVLRPDRSSIAPRRRTADVLRRRARPAEVANVSNAFAVESIDGAREVSTEGPVTVEGQAQIFHAGSNPDLSPLQPQAIPRWRRPVIGPAAESHCLGLLRGHPQPESLDRDDHAGHRQLRQTNGSAPRRAPDQHQRVIGVAHQRRVRRHRRPKHRVERGVPQQRTRHRTLRDPALHRPLSHPPATDGVGDASVPEK